MKNTNPDPVQTVTGWTETSNDGIAGKWHGWTKKNDWKNFCDRISIERIKQQKRLCDC